MNRSKLYGHLLRMVKPMVCLMVINLALTGAASGQISLALKDIQLETTGKLTVRELLSLIEKKSELTFSFHEKDLGASLNDEVVLDSRIQNAYQALQLVSRAEKLTFKQLNNTINVLRKAPQSIAPLKLPSEKKTYPIRGRVIDENEEGLPGATVLMKGSNVGTTTDINGEFIMEVPEGDQVLVISYIGFITQEIRVSAESTYLRISMEQDIQALEEIVVVGYGKQKKESISGSIAKIESQEITQTKTANVANNLAGRVAGLLINARGGEPGQESMEIFIRGKATTGDASPLFVIDGVANRGSFERLNPEDIESISILKDASAAIYGAQAANGVILVTTKRGAKGTPKLHYSNSFSYTQPAKRQQLMNAPQYLTWLDEQNARNGRPQIYQNIIEDYQIGENDPNIWSDTDWWNEAMDSWSPQLQHNLSLSGGSDQFKYYLSGQHLNQDANFKGSEFGFSKTNVRSNIDVRATSFLDLGLDLAGRFENTIGTGGVEDLIRGIYNMAPFEAPYYENGLLRNTSKGNILPGIYGLNGDSEIERKVFNTKLSAKISLDEWVKGLSINAFGAIDILNQGRRVLQKPYDIYFLNGEGEYENLRDNTGTVNLFQQADNEISQTYHARINYERDLEKHSLGGFIAYEQNQVNGEYLAASRKDLVSEDLPYLFSGSEANQDNDGRGWQSARVNYFGRFNYAYFDKYFLELTLRIDGSQNFAKERRFGTFPGASFGWRISEEDFWSSSLIEGLKLRLSWGQLGNDRVNSFQYFQLYNIEEAAVFGDNPLLGTGLSPATTPNPNITWETAEKTNLGIDLSLPNGMLDLTLDAFYEKRSNILAQRNASVPIYTGIELPDENIGKTKNRGFEISALHRRTIGNQLKFRLGGQFTYAQNEIVFVDESPFVPEYQKVEGSPIDYLLVYQADGLYQNKEEIESTPHFPDAKPGDVRFVDTNNDGSITAEDRILLARGPTPRMVYGFSLGLSWKTLEFNAFFQGQSGASTIYRPWDVNQDSWYFDNRWISEEATPDAQSPAAWDMSSSTIQEVSTIWVKKNDFLRIKNVELAYVFPTNLRDPFRISNLRLFVSAFNLGFIYNAVGLYDPESRSGTGWYYPQQRIISTGLSVTF
jgi:TonB-linked SusC/RagA family outer membrane protein